MAKRTHFYFRVTDSSQLNKVDEGEVFQYQIPSVRESEVADFFLRDGRVGQGTDDKGFIDDIAIKGDLQAVILNGWFEKSSKDNFSEPYIPKRERQRLAKEHEKAIKKKDEEEAKQVNEGARSAQPSAPTPSAQPQTTGAKKAAKAKVTTNTTDSTVQQKPQSESQREEKQTRSRKKVILETDYSKFNEKEINNLYTIAYKWVYGNDKDLKKGLRQDIGDKIELIDEYIDYGLAKKKVTDDEIPPMSYLERIPPIANNRELLLFYRRKLNRGAGADFAKKVLFGGGTTSFDVSAMPTSIRIGAAIGRLAFKGAVGGTSLAISGIKSLSDKISEQKRERDASKAAALEAKNVSPSEPIRATPSSVKEGDVVTPAMAKPGTALGQSQQGGITNDTMKKLVDTLVQLKNYIKGKLVEDVDVREAKNATFADITDKSIVSQDKQTAAPIAEASGRSTEGKKGSLLETIMNMLNPMKLFGKALEFGLKGLRVFGGLIGGLSSSLGIALKAIQGFTRAIGAVLRTIGGMVANLAKTVGGGLLRGATSVLTTVGEGVATVGAGTLAAGAAAAVGVAAAGQAIHSVATGGSGDNFISDALGVKNWFGGSSATETPEYKAGLAAQEKRHAERMQAMQKNNAQRLNEAEKQKEVLKEAKEEKKTQQIVDASTKATTTIVQGSGGFSRPLPRTQDSTLQSILKLKSFYGTMPA